MTLDTRQEMELTSGGDTMAHYHLADRKTLSQLQAETRVVMVAGTTSISYGDSIVLADSTSGNIVLTLPVAKGGVEIEVVKTVAANTVTVDGAGSETICGELDMILHAKNTAVRLKAVTGGWIAL